MVKFKTLYVLPAILGAAVLAQKYYGSDLLSGRGEILSSNILIKAYNERKGILKGMEQKMNDPHLYPTTKNLDKKNAWKAIEKIKDYSVKLSSRCGSGTGWYLDYEIPVAPKKYPTKWFIATNAHVVNTYDFSSNPYEQILPVQKGFLNPFRGCSSDEIIIFRSEKVGLEEIILSGNGIDFNEPKNWSNPYIKFFLNYEKSAKNANHSEENWKRLSNINIMYSKLENPKLFYVPLNFLGKKWKYSFLGMPFGSSDYYKDFAVLEVNFRSEMEAERITGNLYKREEKERLNFFDSELLKKKGGDELLRNRDHYFSAGYPGNSYNEYRPFGNYSFRTNSASKLGHWLKGFSLLNRHGQPLMGHTNSEMIDNRIPNMRLRWGNGKYRSWGYNYSLDNMKMGPGASGSLVTNGNGDVLGLYRAHDSGNSFGFVEPLRSEGYMEDSKIILPKYDLIKGAPGQISSYREQLEKYMPNLNTYLKQKWSKEDVIKLH